MTNGLDADAKLVVLSGDGHDAWAFDLTAPAKLTVAERIHERHHSGRSGDLTMALQSGTTALMPRTHGDVVAGHGSPCDYGRYVLILFWWPRAAAEPRCEAIETVDGAPTTAAIVGNFVPEIDGGPVLLFQGPAANPRQRSRKRRFLPGRWSLASPASLRSVTIADDIGRGDEGERPMATQARGANDEKRSTVEIDHKVHPAGLIGFLLVLAAGVAYAAVSIFLDTQQVGETLAIGAFAFLGLTLLIALGFEFVNGFHDTANAVATVIYTNSLAPVTAVIWSGVWNFLGVLTSSGAVAYSVVTLLPVDLILQVGSGAGYAMIFALLIAAVVWNLGTWSFGLPNSSSHALIGSILGVGFANQLLATGPEGTAGVDWSQATKVLTTLLVSPVVGFIGAFVLLRLMKLLIRDRRLYSEPEPGTPPPTGIRALLVATCTAVSFAHGSNDGQKGMGLIMLILIGVAPTAYALNRTMPDSSTPAFIRATSQAQQVFVAKAAGTTLEPAQAGSTLREALRVRKVDDPKVYAALASASGEIVKDLKQYGAISHVPAAATKNLRNEMYVVQDAVGMLTKDAKTASATFPNGGDKTLKAYGGLLEKGTRYIPRWVKIVVALALGLGTMVGWKRIVVTVGEKIGKTHLTYGMGAAAEIMAASTILMADYLKMPVSTTHILSSGVAGTMVADGAGLQGSTVRNIALAWVMTLPAAMLLSGLLYALFLTVVRFF